MSMALMVDAGYGYFSLRSCVAENALFVHKNLEVSDFHSSVFGINIHSAEKS